jgi:NADH-quinone oxidoreductase subunit K
MVPVENYIGLSAIMFTIGILGVLTRRNAIVIFMSIELMLNSANLLFIAFAQVHQDVGGHIFVFFVGRAGVDRGDLSFSGDDQY